MNRSNLRWTVLVVLVCVGFAMTGVAAPGKPVPSAKPKEKADPTEKVTLQYRVAGDAFAPKKFVAVIQGGVSLGLDVRWDLPALKDKDKQAAQDREKKAFDALIRKLEEKQINGVEFECKGEWQKLGIRLRITTVPRLTQRGKDWIKENDR